MTKDRLVELMLEYLNGIENGCEGCKFEHMEEWEEPCKRCMRSHNDYWRAEE